MAAAAPSDERASLTYMGRIAEQVRTHSLQLAYPRPPVPQPTGWSVLHITRGMTRGGGGGVVDKGGRQRENETLC